MQEHLEAIVQVPGMRENMEAITPLRLEGSGEEIGEAIAYLSGPRGTWVTGQVLSVDGGHSIPQGASFEPVVRVAFPELITAKG
jgi:enoyl-[acyl-carrier-protein] reductase (NADH)